MTNRLLILFQAHVCGMSFLDTSGEQEHMEAKTKKTNAATVNRQRDKSQKTTSEDAYRAKLHV